MGELVIFPWRPVATSLWWAVWFGQWLVIVIDGALLFPPKVDPKDALNGFPSFRVLGNHSSQHRKAPLEGSAGGAEVLALLGNDEGQVV